MPPEPARPTFVLVTCEHGGNRVPAEHRERFANARDLIRSHRGWDHDALAIARRIAEHHAAPLLFSRTTRLLVDLNRSLEHPELHGEPIRGLEDDARAAIVAGHWRPYRERVATLVTALVAAGHRVLHCSVHSFTDVLDGRPRELDLSWLFDPARAFESEVAQRWRDAVAAAQPDLRLAFNEPYRGIDDGQTTTLRGLAPDAAYAGIELELRQGLIAASAVRRRLARLLADTMPA